MEFIQTEEHFVFQFLQKGCSRLNLWVNRSSGVFSLRDSWELTNEENPECLGIIYGIVGKIRFRPELPERLVLIKEVSRVGELPLEAHPVYKIRSVLTVPILKSPPGSLGLKTCPKHASQSKEEGSASRFKKLLMTDPLKTAGTAASALASQVVKLNTANSNATNGSSSSVSFVSSVSYNSSFTPSPSLTKALERYEKRILEEFYKLFNDSESFYYSPSGDLSRSLQRQEELSPERKKEALWRRTDDRFFFNKHMLGELLELEFADPWIQPIIQGYVEFVKCPQEYSEPELQDLPSYYEIILISRRSRHRAGTRYKRRGVDEDGNVANFVETEQILLYHRYALSFVLVRGSVPVFWSQPGYRYRPPLVLDRSKEEDHPAFKKHIDELFQTYGSPVVAINLAEKSGREKVISDAFFDNALVYDNEHLLFVSFDFHEFCRGMHFENVDVLIRSIELSIRSMRYCWFDSEGMVCGQRGLFRVNCVDCLDRTNVVQTAIARAVLEIQLTKLGLVPPEQNLEDATKLSFQGLWANNGDIISRQYAGTNALKGDFTRTGERNLSGMMKDGVNSASRYYLNQFRDTLRQKIIDLVTGASTEEEGDLGEGDLDNPKEEEEESGVPPLIGKEDEEQQVKNIIEDCKKLLIPNLDEVVGAWGLIEGDAGDPRGQDDMDIILILVRDAFYVAFYDDASEKVTEFQKIPLLNMEKIEFGIPERDTFSSFRSSKRREEHVIRIHYRLVRDNEEDSGYFYSFCSTNLRFFNNVPVTVSSEEERVESLKSIVDTLAVSYELATNSVPVVHHGKLDRRRSKVPPDLKSSSANTSASLRTVGTRALSKFARLNPMSRRLRGNREEEVRSEEDPSLLSEFLSPLDAGVRTLSRSTENVQRFFENVVEEDPKKDKEEAFSPFEKITKGLQNIGASMGGRSERDEPSPRSEECSEDSQDYMRSRLKESNPKTQFILL